jgi:chromate transporter
VSKNKNKVSIFIELYMLFFKLGCFSFGGGYAAVPLIEREVVEEKKWMEKEQIVDIFAVAQALPGAIALNAAGFIGYTVAGLSGSIISIIGNLTPSVGIVLTLSILFSKVSDNPIVQSAFQGIRPAIIGLIAYAAYKIAKTSLVDVTTVIIMILAFVASTFFNIAPIPLIVFGAVAGIVVKQVKCVLAKKDISEGKDGEQ